MVRNSKRRDEHETQEVGRKVEVKQEVFGAQRLKEAGKLFPLGITDPDGCSFTWKSGEMRLPRSLRLLNPGFASTPDS